MSGCYIGTKFILAWPLNKDGEPGYKVKYQDGYISWSSKNTFEQAYKIIVGDNQALSFSDALTLLKLGAPLRRKSWNGAGQYVFIIGQDPASASSHWTYTNGWNDNLPLQPMLALKNAQNKVAAWVPSTGDLLANDWEVANEIRPLWMGVLGM